MYSSIFQIDDIFETVFDTEPVTPPGADIPPTPPCTPPMPPETPEFSHEVEVESFLSEVGDVEKLKNTSLSAAIQLSLENKVITPMIKEELNWLIKSKRLSKGMTDIEVEEKEQQREEVGVCYVLQLYNSFEGIIPSSPLI